MKPKLKKILDQHLFYIDPLGNFNDDQYKIWCEFLKELNKSYKSSNEKLSLFVDVYIEYIQPMYHPQSNTELSLFEILLVDVLAEFNIIDIRRDLYNNTLSIDTINQYNDIVKKVFETFKKHSKYKEININ